MVYHGFPMFTSTIQWMDKLFPPTPFAEADWYDMPHDVLARISNRIINEAVFDASGHWVCSEVLMDIDGRWKKKATLALSSYKTITYIRTMAAICFQL